MIGSRLLFWLVIKPISLLPYPALYALSDFFYIFFYYFVRYRKKVVNENLRRCFPEKSESEITALQKKFYRHFCDLVLESLKNFSITREQAEERMEQINIEAVNQFYGQGRSVIIAGGHLGNWELWAVATPPHIRHRMIGIYKALNNKYFDHKMRVSRGKFGLELVETKATGAFLTENSNSLIASVFAIDQSPSNPKKGVWVDFFGIPTVALFGTEKYSRDHNFPVVWGHLEKKKRGYYTITYKVVTEHPREMAQTELTQLLHNILEKDILKSPEYWLWSHKRWKHKRPEEN